MLKRAFVIAAVIASCCSLKTTAQSLQIELEMPGTLFGPGSPCFLNLLIENPAEPLSEASIFVALTVGTGQFWFFPGWVQYPPDIDMEVRDIPGHTSSHIEILPEFLWPSGTGAFSGAQFIAAIVYNGTLASNLAEITFGWSETPQPTVTPTPGTSATATPPQPTATSSVPTATPGPHHPGDLLATDPIAGPMRYIPAEELTGFFQGSPDDEPCRDLDEARFVHFLTRPIAMMETEVTRQMWMDLRAVDATLPADPSALEQSPAMACPVQNLDWHEAVLFANLLSLHNGFDRIYFKDEELTAPVTATNYTTGDFYMDWDAGGYRLPTEGEWEHAARAGTTGVFSCEEPAYNAGNCTLCDPGTHPVLESYCVYCANDMAMTAEVGSKWANPWNLRDMHGNVWEWCWDWYGEGYPAGPVTDYAGPTEGSWRCRRGGSWNFDAHYSRGANRGASTPSYRFNYLGVRLVRTLE